MPKTAAVQRPRPCHRCGGLLEALSDRDGDYLACLSCGRHSYPEGAASPMTFGENHARLHGSKAHKTD